MTTEFKSLDEMSSEQKALQKWAIVKSDTCWWIHCNHAPFIPVQTEQKAIDLLASHGITVYAVDRSQKPLTAVDWARYRKDKPGLMQGRGPSLATRVRRWFGGDAA